MMQSLCINLEFLLSVNPCKERPCTHGGKCIPEGDHYRCECPPEYEGPQCVKCKCKIVGCLHLLSQ